MLAVANYNYIPQMGKQNQLQSQDYQSNKMHVKSGYNQAFTSNDVFIKRKDNVLPFKTLSFSGGVRLERNGKEIIPNKICHCSDLKPKLLSVKFNNTCNGACDFCIDKGGRNPRKMDVDKMAKEIISEKDFQIVTITGGEPLLNFDELIELLEKIRPYKKEIILNTNGSLLSKERVEKLNGLIDELRIACHHYDEKKNSDVIKTKVSFENMKESLESKEFKTTFNMVLTKALEDEKENFVDKLVDVCHDLHIDGVRISELKYIGPSNNKEVKYAQDHVKAWDFFKDLNVIEPKSSEQLVTDGCIDLFNYRGIQFHLKRLCGYKLKEREHTFKVIYSDGIKADDWIYGQQAKSANPFSK